MTNTRAALDALRVTADEFLGWMTDAPQPSGTLPISDKLIADLGLEAVDASGELLRWKAELERAIFAPAPPEASDYTRSVCAAIALRLQTPATGEVVRSMPQSRQSRILWARIHAIEAHALRLEEHGQDAAEVRRIYITLGEQAIALAKVEAVL